MPFFGFWVRTANIVERKDMKFTLILAVIKSIADLLKALFGWSAKKEKEKRDAVDDTTSGIGKGRPF